jgi:hypothetical protein
MRQLKINGVLAGKETFLLFLTTTCHFSIGDFTAHLFISSLLFTAWAWSFEWFNNVSMQSNKFLRCNPPFTTKSEILGMCPEQSHFYDQALVRKSAGTVLKDLNLIISARLVILRAGDVITFWQKCDFMNLQLTLFYI